METDLFEQLKLLYEQENKNVKIIADKLDMDVRQTRRLLLETGLLQYHRFRGCFAITFGTYKKDWLDHLANYNDDELEEIRETAIAILEGVKHYLDKEE